MLNNKFTICFLGDARAADIFTLRWAKFFSRRGHKVHLFSYFPFDRKEDNENIELHLIKKVFPAGKWFLNTFINFPVALMKIKKEIKKIKPDIVHAHCVTSYGKLAAFTGFHPLVVTAWGSDILINPYQNLITKLATKKSLKNADLLTCDAKHMKKAMVGLGAEVSKIKIINFGIDTKKFSPGPKSKKLRQELGLKPGDMIVISLRGLEPIYDVETLIKAVPIVLQKNKKARFLILGSGSQEKKLKDLSSELGIAEKVKFSGWVSNDKLPDFLRTSDVYVSTSLSDGGIASSTAEAMACGLPVVVTDSGENKKWIKDGKNGFIVSVKNPIALAERVIYLLENKEKRLGLGKQGRDTIKKDNDYESEMLKMEKIYRALPKNKQNNFSI